MAVRYDGQAPVEPLRPSPVRVQRVDPGQTIICRMLSDQIRGINTHWVQKRSRYCDGDACNPVFHRTETIWKGYVAAELWRNSSKDWLPVVLELTEHAELDMRGIYQRGQVWELRRQDERGQKHKPVECHLISHPKHNDFPPAFDIRLVLIHLYHVLRIDLDVKNPLPPRLILPSTPGTPSVPEGGGAK